MDKGTYDKGIESILERALTSFK